MFVCAPVGVRVRCRVGLLRLDSRKVKITEATRVSGLPQVLVCRVSRAAGGLSEAPGSDVT